MLNKFYLAKQGAQFKAEKQKHPPWHTLCSEHEINICSMNTAHHFQHKKGQYSHIFMDKIWGHKKDISCCSKYNICRFEHSNCSIAWKPIKANMLCYAVDLPMASTLVVSRTVLHWRHSSISFLRVSPTSGSVRNTTMSYAIQVNCTENSIRTSLAMRSWLTSTYQ